MKVVVTRQGFWGGTVRERGAILDWPSDAPLASWVESVDKQAEPAPAATEERGAPNPSQASGTWATPQEAEPEEV